MAHAARSPPCKKETLTGEEFLPYATLASSITPPQVSRRRIYFAARAGCWPGRALPTSGCPQPGRPRSGCALGPFVPHAAHAPMEVSRTASRRLLPNARFTGARCQLASRPASGAYPTHGRPACYVIRLVRAHAVYSPAQAANPSPKRITLHSPPPSRSAGSLHPTVSTRNHLGAATVQSATQPRRLHRNRCAGSR